MRIVLIVFIIVLALLIGSTVWLIERRRATVSGDATDLVRAIVSSASAEPNRWEVREVEGLEGPVWINASAELMVSHPAKPGRRANSARLRVFERGAEVQLTHVEKLELYDAFLAWTALEPAQQSVAKYSREHRRGDQS